MNPKVSVCLITYNHEKYLAKCLDSILSQDCNYTFEIIIGEDNSTDGTQLIVNQFLQRYPELIRIVTSDSNVGMVENWRRTINASLGEYIAIIEGDDFWTSKHKLQRQADLMDSHLEYALCFHNVEVIFDDRVQKDNPIGALSKHVEYTIEDVIIKDWFIPTCSMLVRRSMMPDFPLWTKKLKAIDMVVQLLASNNGDIGYIDEKMGTYRIHAAGQSQVQWAGKGNILEFTIVDILKKFDSYSKGKYQFIIRERLERSFKILMARNSPFSRHYFRAMFGLIGMNPKRNFSILKDWMILNIVPEMIYKTYRGIK